MRLVRADEVARRRIRQQRARRQRRRAATASVLVILVLVTGTVANTLRPLPAAAVKLDVSQWQIPASAINLAWPAQGQAALLSPDYGLLGTFGPNEPIPTASIAKVLTALCVLEKYPLELGEAGPTITFSKSDVALYQYQLTQNGSNVPVYEGSQMTLYQALEALLIPSANNVADSLAIWAFGSLEQYADYANAFVLRNELVNTTVGSDASGLDNSTQSTATDVARLSELAQDNPVVMQIASKKSTTLPAAGLVYNYNTALGIAGITGLKTGNNDGNKGALAFTANITVAENTIPISGAVMGQASLDAAITQSIALVRSVAQNFEELALIDSATPVGYAATTWGERVPVSAAKPVTIVRWKSSPVTVKYTLHTTTATEVESIGALELSAGTTRASVKLAIQSPAETPDFWWRATRLP